MHIYMTQTYCLLNAPSDAYLCKSSVCQCVAKARACHDCPSSSVCVSTRTRPWIRLMRTETTKPSTNTKQKRKQKATNVKRLFHLGVGNNVCAKENPQGGAHEASAFGGGADAIRRRTTAQSWLTLRCIF